MVWQRDYDYMDRVRCANRWVGVWVGSLLGKLGGRDTPHRLSHIFVNIRAVEPCTSIIIAALGWKERSGAAVSRLSECV